MRTTLEKTLVELREELASADNLSAEQRDLLRSAIAAIQDALLEEKEIASGLVVRLQEAAQHLEATHPALTNAVGRVADLLSQIGI
jgi:GTP1/Obg family GTP-binding protein